MNARAVVNTSAEVNVRQIDKQNALLRLCLHTSRYC